ncbi:family 16 glycosylhydrolase [Nocardioides gansuensis]|nr:FG-GAP-like repeat-containing protein [Nocardioides gansuensis]
MTPDWLRELLAALSLATLGPGVPAPAPDLVVPPAGTVAAPAAAAPTYPREVFADEFDGPVETHWRHVSTSSPERLRQDTVDGRSVLALGPESHLVANDAVPYQVGATYRVSAVLKMPSKTGTHPAFWLRSHDFERPDEIDVVETWGGKQRCERVQLAFYWRYLPPVGSQKCVGGRYPDPAEWHEYSVEFTYMGGGRDPQFDHAAPMRFFVDGQETWSARHSPSLPSFLHLQHKRNCPEDEQPTCGETASGPEMLVDRVEVEAVGRQPSTSPATLVGVRRTGPTTVDLMALDPADHNAVAAQLTLPMDESDWHYATGDYDGDTVDDLYAVARGPRGSIRVDVLDGLKQFSVPLTRASVVAPGRRSADAQHLVGDYNGDGRDDLYLVDAVAGRTVVRVLDASAGFQTALAEPVTAAPALEPEGWRLATGDINADGLDDLLMVDLDDGAGRAAVHVLDAATGFSSFVIQATTPSGALDPAAWSVTTGDANADGRDDLYLLARDSGGVTAAHVLDAASGFTAYHLEAATALPATTDPSWRLAEG